MNIFVKILIFGFFCTSFQIQANPFAIKFSPKKNVTNEDYIEIQNKLRAVDIIPLINKLYVKDNGYNAIQGFLYRSSRGIRRVLIDSENGLYPIQQLEKIGRGSDMCIVSCASYDGIRSQLLTSIPEALKSCGFNGYFYYRLGGFPNPTGKEIQYAGVPYCFKVFQMIEAQMLGFNKVLWIDASCLPLRDPTPLFQWLDQTGIYFQGAPASSNLWKFIFPETRQILKDETGIDVLHALKVAGAVFGLKMDDVKTTKFIDEYYRMVQMGTPFLSCFPEEFVLTALIGKFQNLSWKPSPFNKWLRGGEGGDDIDLAKKEGYFFYLRAHGNGWRDKIGLDPVTSLPFYKS